MGRCQAKLVPVGTSPWDNVTINFCSPPSLETPGQLLNQIKARGQLGTDSKELTPQLVGQSDVLYCTRVQKERFMDLKLYEKVKDSFIVDKSVMKACQEQDGPHASAAEEQGDW